MSVFEWDLVVPLINITLENDTGDSQKIKVFFHSIADIENKV